MAYYIGTREFDDLIGDIVLPTPQHDVQSYSGQDGLVVFAQGTKGREFTLESHFHSPSWAAACTLMAAYYAEPTLAPYNIIRDTEDYNLTPIRFVVLGVHVSIQPMVYWTGLRSTGRVILSPAFLVRAEWRMVAIDTSLVIGVPEPEPTPETAP